MSEQRVAEAISLRRFFQDQWEHLQQLINDWQQKKTSEQMNTFALRQTRSTCMRWPLGTTERESYAWSERKSAKDPDSSPFTLDRAVSQNDSASTRRRPRRGPRSSFQPPPRARASRRPPITLGGRDARAPRTAGRECLRRLCRSDCARWRRVRQDRAQISGREGRSRPGSDRIVRHRSRSTGSRSDQKTSGTRLNG
jgi:hypothetical protein